MARSSATALRGKLPTEQYLFLLHQAAVSGWMPSFDHNGKVVLDEVKNADNTVSVDTRVKVLTYLTDKTLPAAKVEALEDDPDPAALAAQTPEALRHTPTAALERAIDAEFVTQDTPATPTHPAQDTAFERFRRTVRG